MYRYNLDKCKYRMKGLGKKSSNPKPDPVEETKADFDMMLTELNKYLSNVKDEFKQFGDGFKVKKPLRPPICRIGSKRPIRDTIYSLMPSHSTYIEPFVGSGAIYWAKEPSDKEVLNDLDKNLIEGYKLIKSINTRNFKKHLDTIPELQSFVNKNHTSPEDKLTKNIIMACNTFSSSGRGKIYRGSNPYIKLKNIDKYQERLKNTTILNQDYKKVIKDYDGKDTFFFLDPPYEKSDTERLYKHGSFNFEELVNILKGIKGKFMLTLNDSPNIRNIFKDFKIKPIIVKGNNQESGIGSKDREELIIMNYSI